jgi:hypothetical protein
MHMIGNKQITIDGTSAIVRAYFFNPYAKDLPGGGLEYSLGGGFYNHKLAGRCRHLSPIPSPKGMTAEC